MSTCLSEKNRRFFTLVKEAMITNPFSLERMELDQKIAAFPGNVERKHNIEATVSAIERKIDELEEESGFVRNYDGMDRHLVEMSVAFLFFYKFRKKFDVFIQKQIQAGEKAIPLEFTEEFKHFLSQKGFSDDETRQAIEHSYQFRRAFHFIDRNLIGRSPVMKELRYNLWNNIFTHNLDLYRRFLLNRMEDFSTLILGETGSGKGTVAAAIGRSGYIPFDLNKRMFAESFMQSFVSINLSQFPETLIESELFGHKKGAFTGAIEDYTGVLGRCSLCGAIFLDEIGEISEPVQIKLLQVLQDRIYYPVGSRQQQRFQGRVIAATNRSIEDLRNSNVFRDDFYYRLCSDVIVVPTLYQRIQEDPAELDDLLRFIVKRIVGESAPELAAIVKDVIDKQLGADYPWYGNVRELEQCVRSVILKKMYKGDTRQKTEDADFYTRFQKGELTAQELMAGYCRLLYQKMGTFEAVARQTDLDRRTVTKWIRNTAIEIQPLDSASSSSEN